MPPPPWTNDRYWTRGRILGFSEGRFRFHYEPGVDILTAYDRDLRRGLYWLPKLAYLPWWERSFPMRLLMHFWSAATPLQPLHAGAAGLPDGGVLIAGLSGSGKSTTTLACLDSDLLYAGDDYIAADCETPHAYSLYNAAKVEADNLDRLPFLRPLLANPGGLANGEKAMTFLVRHCPAKLTAGFPLRAILLPKVTGLRDTTIVPARPMDALAAIAPTTILHLAEDSALIMRKVSKLVRALPVYRLNAGVDLPQIPAAILRLLRG
ncbi:MAG TPA: hypothetical protein DEH78_05095 [Solibacterales bacterium]|nr:hypothetical protein [Bryobacterales bacterium]